MKRLVLMLSIACLIVLAACTPPRRTPSVVRPVATEVLPTVTLDGHLVEVTRVIGTAEPTATPAPCTPLPEGMRLTLSMAEQARTILLEVEGLLPEDKPIVLLNGRSPNHSSEIELTLANPVGPGGRYQDLFHLGENDIVNWSGQIIHQRGAACFEFTFPLTEPVVLAGITPTPKPTTTPLPLPTPTITPIPTTLATRTIEATATDCPIPEMLAQNKLDLVFPDCIVWLDSFDNETGFIVELGYLHSGEWFLYHTPANVTAMHIPPEDAPRLMESDKQCLSRQSIVVEVTAVLPDGERRFAGMGLDAECDLRQLPTATGVPSQETTWTTYQSDTLQLALQHPDTWTAEERDGILYLMSPERYPLDDSPQQIVYYVYSGTFPSPEHKPFAEVITADLSEDLQQIFSYTTETIGEYTIYRTTHMPSAEGALTVFFAAEDRFVSLALTPYRLEDPFEAQDQQLATFEQILASVQLLNDE